MSLDNQIATLIAEARRDEGIKAFEKAIEVVRLRGSYGRKETVAALREEMNLRYGNSRSEEKQPSCL